MPEFSQSSKDRLETAVQPLQDLFNEVIKTTDCTVVCGFRNQQDQDAAVAAGNSRTPWPTSKHNHIPSKAVDVVPYPINWEDTQGFEAFSKVVKGCAAKLGIVVEWGGDWNGFKDRPHWQVPG